MEVIRKGGMKVQIKWFRIVYPIVNNLVSSICVGQTSRLFLNCVLIYAESNLNLFDISEHNLLVSKTVFWVVS